MKVSFTTVIGKRVHVLVLTNTVLVVSLICPWLWTEKWNTELQWVQLLFLPYQFRTYKTGLLW